MGPVQVGGGRERAEHEIFLHLYMCVCVVGAFP